MGLFLKKKKGDALLTEKKSITKFTKHTILEESLFLNYKKEGMRPLGEFPRRVKAGDPVLAIESTKQKLISQETIGRCLILSPVNGIARLSDEGIYISQDGILQSRNVAELKEFTFKEFIEKLSMLSLVSHDYNCLSLSVVFQKIKEGLQRNREYNIILSPFTTSGHIDFASLILQDFNDEFMQFKGNMTTLFRNSSFKDYISPNNLTYRYPAGIPEYFITKYGEGVKSEDAIYLGAETIYQLLGALYRNIPFYQRYISVLMVDKAGRLKKKEEAYLVYNGQNLNFIKEMIPDNYQFFTYNSIYDNNEAFHKDEIFYIDIYRHYAIIFFEKKYNGAIETSPSSCLDCDYCNFICPVDAKPYFLIREPLKFKEKLCIECSLCTVHCPGAVNLRLKIHELKNRQELANVS